MARWEKILQRNFPPLAWTTSARQEFHGITVGPMTWVRDREMAIKYNTTQTYLIQDPDALYRSNIADLLREKRADFESAVDTCNRDIMEIVQVNPGNTLSDLRVLNEQHNRVYALMLAGFDVAIDIRGKLDEVITPVPNGLEEYLATPWNLTAIQREQSAIVQARESIALNPSTKVDVLEKLAHDFGYLHQDYLGEPWTAADYEQALTGAEYHSGMSADFDLAQFSEYQQYLISVFRKMIFMYEEGRNAMVRAVWAMKETFRALGFDPDILLYMTVDELEAFALGGASIISDDLVAMRKQAFAIHFDNGVYTEYSGEKEVSSLIEREGISTFWDDVAEKPAAVLKGQVAFKGYATGAVRLVFTQEDANAVQEGEILVSPMTQVEFLSGIRRCSAIVTDEGGVICHAAIVAREFGKPAILGTLQATRTFKNGDMVEVDAIKGEVRLVA